MSKITEYTEATRFDSGDILIKDGANGTKKITIPNAARDFAGAVSSINHRNVYGGKNLGSAFTTTQKTAIKNGTFDDMFPGDYITINGHRYDIADMDYWYNHGDTAFTKHHLVMFPHSSLYNHVMNDTNTTEGGYVGSKMYTEGLAQARDQIKTDFGDMLLTHREYLTNAVTDGHPSAGAWFDSDIDLANEIMMYGCYVHMPANNGVTIPTRYTNGKQQLAIFKLNPVNKQLGRITIWLRDVVSAASFANVYFRGSADYNNASGSYGVLPFFAVGVA